MKEIKTIKGEILNHKIIKQSKKILLKRDTTAQWAVKKQKKRNHKQVKLEMKSSKQLH